VGPAVVGRGVRSGWGWALFSSTSARSRAVFAAISAGSGGPSRVLIRMRESIAVGTDRVVLPQRFQVFSGRVRL
jgi:hypothetical protein